MARVGRWRGHRCVASAGSLKCGRQGRAEDGIVDGGGRPAQGRGGGDGRGRVELGVNTVAKIDEPLGLKFFIPRVRQFIPVSIVGAVDVIHGSY